MTGEPATELNLRNVAKLALFAICFLLYLEIACRIYNRYGVEKPGKELPPGPEWKHYAEDFEKAGKSKMQYYDYYIFTCAPFESTTINFTGYYGSRLTPDSVERSKAKQKIWMFGSSTLQEMGTIDKLTIANQLAFNLNARGWKARIENFGTGGFHLSQELVKFIELLRRVKTEERPDTVIFYDGYTDSIFSLYHGAGNMGEDMRSKLEALVEKKYGKLIPYLLSQGLSEYSDAWRLLVAPRINNANFQTTKKDSSEAALEYAVELYARNIYIAKAICKEYNITPFFILQPLLVFKQGRTASEDEYYRNKVADLEKEWTRKFYAMVKERFKHDASVVDLSAIFDNDDGKDFTDFGHTTPLSGAKIGKALADLMTE